MLKVSYFIISYQRCGEIFRKCLLTVKKAGVTPFVVFDGLAFKQAKMIGDEGEKNFLPSLPFAYKFHANLRVFTFLLSVREKENLLSNLFLQREYFRRL